MPPPERGVGLALWQEPLAPWLSSWHGSWGAVLSLHQLSPCHVTQCAKITRPWVAKDEELLGREIPYSMLQPTQKLWNSSYKINQTQVEDPPAPLRGTFQTRATEERGGEEM